LLIRIATRKSALALWQAEHVAAELRNLDEVEDVELVPLSTRGDEILDRSLQKIGGKGLFIKELEVAMQEGAADIAVHSMKDVPAEMPDGFCVAAVLERASHADALVAGDCRSLEDLPQGARVGSSSLRRQAQLRMMRPDLVIEPLRGNVNTRLAKLEAGDYDAIILAAAGLERLGLQEHISRRFTTDEMLPAAAQGVIGIECRSDRSDLRAVLANLNHARTAETTLAERATFAKIDGDELNLTALVAMPDGSRYLRESLRGATDDAQGIGERLADKLLGLGAAELLEQAASDG
jgi:hydroxymethylbilane synthase